MNSNSLKIAFDKCDKNINCVGKSILKDKSYAFAMAVVKLCRWLQNQEKEYVLSRQLLRSGTAIGALIREAEFAESRADFAHKMKIALKEANETDYWLRLLHDTRSVSQSGTFADLQQSCRELIAMLVATVKKLKNGSTPAKAPSPPF